MLNSSFCRTRVRTVSPCSRTAKRSTNICLNVNSWTTARQAIEHLLRQSPNKDYIRQTLHQTEKIGVKQFMERLLETHEPIADQFLTEVGAELMTIDGRIMKRILKAFVDARKPVLGIHDGVVCRATDADFAKKAMRRAYFEMLGHKPVIKQVH